MERGTQRRKRRRRRGGLPSFPLTEYSQWLTDRSSAYSIQFEKHLDITFEEDRRLKKENGYEGEHFLNSSIEELGRNETLIILHDLSPE